MAELLALADAVREGGGTGADGGGGSADFSDGKPVGYISGESWDLAKGDAPQGKYFNETESWSADSPDAFVRVSCYSNSFHPVHSQCLRREQIKLACQCPCDSLYLHAPLFSKMCWLLDKHMLKEFTLLGPKQALLARYTPLGSSSCPLFARKFGDSALTNVERLSAQYLTSAGKNA
jgi:hypothetical protein